jgi:uncharacterized protein YjbJ (UPF0337 family)
MNRDRIQGTWKQVAGKAREKWGLLMGDKQGISAGRQGQFDGAAQRCYGQAREHADRRLAEQGQRPNSFWLNRDRASH